MGKLKNLNKRLDIQYETWKLKKYSKWLVQIIVDKKNEKETYDFKFDKMLNRLFIH